MEDFWLDVRYSLRMLFRNPGFTLAAVLALGLGIGANTAIFSVVNGVLLHSLPYRDPERLVRVFESNPAQGEERNEVAGANYLDWVAQNKVFDPLGAYGDTGANLSGGDAPERVLGAVVTDGVLRLLAVSPQLGRVFTPEEEDKSARVVILSDGLWRRRFGADPGVLGRTLTVNGRPRQIVGVMPPGFRFPPDQDKDLWVPLGLSMGMMKDDRSSHFLNVIGRLRPGVSLAQARSEMDVIAHRLAERYPDSNKGWSIALVPLQEQVVGDVRPALLILLTTTAFVLIIACSNVANLLLAQTTVREREVAVRAALGASRKRLARQYLTESVLLALLGGFLGLLLAYWGIRLLLASNPDYIPRLSEVGIDTQVLSFTLVLSLLTGIVFGLVPAFRASRTDLHEPLKEGGRGSSSGFRHNRLRSLLVVSQTALALVLLVGAGLMVRSLLGLQRLDPGFQPDQALTLEIFLPPAKYPALPALNNFYQQLVDRVRVLPGVKSVGAVTNLPLSGGDMTISFTVDDQPPPAAGKKPEVSFRGATSDYFRAAGIHLLQGRSFTTLDTPTSPKVAIINQTMAQRYWPGMSPVGHRIVSHGVPYEIVGVIHDVRYWGLSSPVRPELFLPLSQDKYYFVNLVARSSSDPRQLTSLIRQEIHKVDPDQPIFHVRTLTEVLAHSISRSNLYTRLLLIFAGLALLLAALGIYSVIAYSVHQRSHEIGIRMALGARNGDVLRLIVGQGLALAVSGVVVGLLCSLGVTRVLASLLYGISLTDPLTFGGTAVLLAAVALAASYLPARQAIRIDPVHTLRDE